MSAASVGFALAARKDGGGFDTGEKNTRPTQPPRIVGTPRITYEGQSTFWKMCTVCAEMMPHVRRDDFTECVVCGHKTYAVQPTESPRLGGS